MPMRLSRRLRLRCRIAGMPGRRPQSDLRRSTLFSSRGQIMTVFRMPALAALLLFTHPAFAASDVADTCAAGQVFAKGPISVTGAYMRATLKGAASAGGYLSIRNTGEVGDTLTAITSDAATTIAVHQMKMNG